MTSFRTLDELDPKGKRILLRVDLNVPMENGKVTDLTRIERVAPTIRELARKGGKVVLLAHFGRPKGKPDPKESLGSVAPVLEETLRKPVRFAPDCIGEAAASAVASMREGDIFLLENTRFHPGEEKNDPGFAKSLAANGDVFVNDAFSAAHRAHASTEGVAHLLPSFAGRAMQAELEALAKALDTPRRPVTAIVGGAKVSTKLELLGNLSAKVETLIIGGGMANTFLAARGIEVGRSLCEQDLAKTAREIDAKAEAKGCEVMLPVDAVVATEFKGQAAHRVAALDDIQANEMILDIGPRSVAAITAKLRGAATLVWNGPVGAFELPPFDAGTDAIAREAAALTQAGNLVSIGGGGDTVAALNRAGVADKLTYVSTAGGAFLEWLEGKALPGVEALRKT
ncbi:MAG: phosphoglycerate kinase [Hyphomicrobiales bacterium]|nr:phosphoglycerate kinase [Hyphomicrobiales bacterium]